MEHNNAITAKRAATSMQQGKPSNSLSKQSEIVKMLGKCSMRKGSAVTVEILAIYAQDLSTYELADVAAVLDEIGKEAPQDFKQLWPAVGTIIAAIEAKVRARKAASNDPGRRWLEYVEKFKAEGGEVTDVGQMLCDVIAKVGLGND